MKLFGRLISVLLCLLITAGMIAVIPVSVSAADRTSYLTGEGEEEPGDEPGGDPDEDRYYEGFNDGKIEAIDDKTQGNSYDDNPDEDSESYGNGFRDGYESAWAGCDDAENDYNSALDFKYHDYHNQYYTEEKYEDDNKNVCYLEAYEERFEALIMGNVTNEAMQDAISDLSCGVTIKIHFCDSSDFRETSYYNDYRDSYNNTYTSVTEACTQAYEYISTDTVKYRGQCKWSLDTSTGKATVTRLTEADMQANYDKYAALDDVDGGEYIQQALEAIFTSAAKDGEVCSGACPFDLNSVTEVEFAEGINVISGSAFENSATLKSVSYPQSSLQQIMPKAFKNCDALTSAYIPGTVNSSTWFLTGCSVFENCDNLVSAEFGTGENLRSVGPLMFHNCPKLKNVNLGESVRYIFNYGFAHCKALEAITFPTSLDQISSYAFLGCTALKELNFECQANENDSTDYDGVSSIGDGAFMMCTSLENVNVPESLSTIHKYAFTLCNKLKEIHLPKKASISAENRDDENREYYDVFGTGLNEAALCAYLGVDNLDSALSRLDVMLDNAISSSLLSSDEAIAEIESNLAAIADNFSFITDDFELTFYSDYSLLKYSDEYQTRAENAGKSFNLTVYADDINTLRQFLYWHYDEAYERNLVLTADFDGETGVCAGADVNIDLNGHTITGTIDLASSGRKIKIYDSSDVSSEEKGGIITSGGNVIRGAGSGNVTILDGTYSSDVTEFVPEDKVVSKNVSGDRYTVVNPSDAMSLSGSDGRQIIIPSTSHNTERMMLLGVQKRDSSEDAVRFISAVQTGILRGAKDYGYIVTKFPDSYSLEDGKARAERIVSGKSGTQKISCRDTYNQLADDAHSSNDLSQGDYKYISFAVTDVDKDAVIGARFYVERSDGTFVYGDYFSKGSEINNYSCVAQLSSLLTIG